ncbi:hypothetical protein KIN20_014359 [Parelaphostrongylus tenuis]|uniref:Uncharacterized protein n=1 Tax=Parelaphostrongylus tenuis TaxID=148309 RepID=A0AAD5MDJ2_PARTN|nr:hypothetical protein KIN20_014359 [Parelaphostrongylus tenuis]
MAILAKTDPRNTSTLVLLSFLIEKLISTPHFHEQHGEHPVSLKGYLPESAP